MNIKQLLGTYRPLIEEGIKELLEEKRALLRADDSMVDAIIDNLEEVAVRGKLIRGSLVCATYERLGGADARDAASLAVAMELIHTALLIHDDWMDGDDLRRGLPATHKRYEQLAQQEGFKDAALYGMSVATCIGDMLFFWAVELVSRTELSKDSWLRILKMFGEKIPRCAIGQIIDLRTSHGSEQSRTDDIVRMHLLKTGTYTFSLPFLLGAVLAEADDTILSSLDEIGELMGILFQVRDDDIGFFGSREDIGKPVGSDVIEDKKTLHSKFLFEAASEDQTTFLRSVFGNHDATDSDILQVQSLARKLEVPERIAEVTSQYSARANELLQNASFDGPMHEFIESLLAFILARKK